MTASPSSTPDGPAPEIVLAAVTELGYQPRDLRRIVITHAHPDHVRGLAELRELTRSQVLIHLADAAWLSGGRVPAGGRCGSIGTFVDRLPLLHWTPVKPDVDLIDNEIIQGSNGLRVIHTPGHSPGHVCLLHEPTSTLLTGDAILNRGSTPSHGPNFLANDLAERDVSLARLPDDITAVGFAHGAPLSGHAVEAYQHFRLTAADDHRPP